MGIMYSGIPRTVNKPQKESEKPKMSEKEKLTYCSNCQKLTIHRMFDDDNNGNNAKCSICGTLKSLSYWRKPISPRRFVAIATIGAIICFVIVMLLSKL